MMKNCLKMDKVTFKEQYDMLEQQFEPKQQMIEKSEIQIKETLHKQYDQQVIELQKQMEYEEKAFEVNREQAIHKIKKLYENRKEIISGKYKKNLVELKRTYIDNSQAMR